MSFDPAAATEPLSLAQGVAVGARAPCRGMPDTLEYWLRWSEVELKCSCEFICDRLNVRFMEDGFRYIAIEQNIIAGAMRPPYDNSHLARSFPISFFAELGEPHAGPVG